MQLPDFSQFLPMGVAMLAALTFCGVFVALAVLIGPRRQTVIKAGPFECGSEPIGSPRGRFGVKFYQIALLFLVFDIEAAFMYPWALLYKDLSVSASGGVSLFGFSEMLVFVVILATALAFVWRKKAIGWD